MVCVHVGLLIADGMKDGERRCSNVSTHVWRTWLIVAGWLVG